MRRWLIRTSAGISCEEEGDRAEIKGDWFHVYDFTGNRTVAFFRPSIVREVTVAQPSS